MFKSQSFLYAKTNFLIFILQCFSPSIFAQDSGCNNENFELGTLEGWQTFIGFITTQGEVDVSTPSLSITQHVITNTNLSPDPIASNCELELLRVAEGGNHSLRLGNTSTGGGAERISKTFTVTPENSYFLVQYAVLLEDPGHSPHLQPRFEMRVFDETGELLPCGEYAVRAGPDIPGFVPCNGWEILPWTSVGFELSSYVGQEISIELITTDCGKGDHAGYAYMDAACQSLNIGFESGICVEEGTAMLSVAEGFAEYLWSNGATTRETEMENVQVGDVVWVDLTSFTGCTITLQDTIEAPPNSLEVVLEEIESPEICEGETVEIQINGSNLETIYWKDLEIYANPLELTPIITTTYELIPIDLNGCQHAPEMLTIVVYSPPMVEIEASQDSICNEESVQLFLEVNNDDGFRWLDNEDNASMRTLQLSETTTFYATADGLGTCPDAIDSLTVFVEGSQPMTYTKTADLSICTGETISLRIDERVNVESIDWRELNSATFSVEATPNFSQFYHFTLTASGCVYEQKDSIWVEVIPNLELPDFGENRCVDTPVLLEANQSLEGVTYLWQDASSNATFLASESGMYSVEISNACETINQSVNLQFSETANCQFTLPSAFSPNGDGINDVLQISSNCAQLSLSNFAFKVFNRWGEVVFESYDNQTSWDGNFGREALPNGLYVWWLEYRNPIGADCGEDVFRQGNVVLVR